MPFVLATPLFQTLSRAAPHRAVLCCAVLCCPCTYRKLTQPVPGGGAIQTKLKLEDGWWLTCEATTLQTNWVPANCRSGITPGRDTGGEIQSEHFSPGGVYFLVCINFHCGKWNSARRISMVAQSYRGELIYEAAASTDCLWPSGIPRSQRPKPKTNNSCDIAAAVPLLYIHPNKGNKNLKEYFFSPSFFNKNDKCAMTFQG